MAEVPLDVLVDPPEVDDPPSNKYCPDCGGTGKDSGDEDYASYCPTCGGTGRM